MFALLLALAFAQDADAKPDAADVDAPDAPDVEQMAEEVHDLAEEIRALTAEVRAFPKHGDTGLLVDDSCSMDEAGPVEEVEAIDATTDEQTTQTEDVIP